MEMAIRRIDIRPIHYWMTWCIFVRRLDCSYTNAQRQAFQWSNYTYLHFCIHKHNKHCRKYVSRESVCGTLSMEAFMSRHDPYCSMLKKWKPGKKLFNKFLIDHKQIGEKCNICDITIPQANILISQTTSFECNHTYYTWKWGKKKRDTEATKANCTPKADYQCLYVLFFFFFFLPLLFNANALHWTVL